MSLATPTAHPTDGEQGRTALKFGVLLYPDGTLLDQPRQFRRLEELGFDQVVVPDHSSDLRDRSGPWFDGWSVLALAAAATERIRIGTRSATPS